MMIYEPMLIILSEMEDYRSYLNKAGIQMSDDDWAVYEPRIFLKEFKKNDIILEQGQVENYLSIVVKGVARNVIDTEDKEVTTTFVFENGYLSSYESFLTRTPSHYSVQALTDVVIWRASYDSCQYFFENTSIGNFIGRISAEILYISKAKRELSFLTESAEERYLNLLKQDPQLFQKVSLKHIASYIGITPQALSRIRARIV